MDDNSYNARVMIDYHVPPNYAERTRQALREDAWLNLLLQVILPNKNKWVVIRYKDATMQGSFAEEYRVGFDVSLAIERRVEFMSYEAMPLRALSMTAMGELRYRIQTKWHKFWNTERVKRG